MDEFTLHAHLLSLPCKILLVLDGRRQVVEENVSVGGCEGKGVHWVVNGKPFNQRSRYPYLEGDLQLISLALLTEIDQVEDAL